MPLLPLVLDGIAKRYGRTRVLDDVTARVAPGRITALVGPNGSGKSTLNRILLGFVRPDAGQVRLGGVSLLEGHAARRDVGYMPQQARFPDQLVARDLIGLLRQLRGDAPTDATVLEALDITPLLDLPLGQLSGGQRQRVNAALALLFRPALAVLDEPTSGLDPVTAQRFKGLLRVAADEGRLVLVTSHVLSELDTLADDVLFLLDGRVRFAGSVAALRATAGDGTLEAAIAQLMARAARAEAA